MTVTEPHKPLSDAELAELCKAAAVIPTDDAWFTLESPWLEGGMETLVQAGSPDPHVAVPVCDFMDIGTAGQENDFTDDEWHSRNWANAEFIATFDPPTVKRLLATIDSLRADRDALKANQRTPRTHEICPYGPERCNSMYDFQWCECEKADCPMRASLLGEDTK